MVFSCSKATLRLLLLTILFTAVALDQDSPPCDINRRNTTCPSDRCCVQDEFQPDLIYCKRIGTLGHPCSTKPSLSTCPCAYGLYCKPNIDTATFTSLYGRCDEANDPGFIG